MKVIFYITQYEHVKDATKVYLETISRALTGSRNINLVAKIKAIEQVDYVVTITVTDFLKLKINKPRLKIIHWHQGIIPEEARLRNEGPAKYHIFSALEYLTLKLAHFSFFVSKEMKKHYEKKYNYHRDSHFIMPCFNASIKGETYFLSKDYDRPEFVYMGSLSTWQCIDKTLSLFKTIQQKLPDAKLTILTAEEEKAKKLCAEHQVEATIDYVPLEKLDGKLKKYTYGFLLRENITVNQVATPTKMSTYLASGIIPVFSTCIRDFRPITALKHSFPVKDDDLSEMVDDLILFHNQEKDALKIRQEYQGLFSTYYNAERYIEEIKSKFAER